MPFALEVIKAWGFIYKTVAFVWIKQNKKNNDLFWGCGHYTRANAEICLLAIKGRPKKLSSAVHQVIISHRREHSRKPDEQYLKIEQLFGGDKLELFARHKCKGWSSWGKEIE
jgi:N6-adenosine-specific RNA methylase IME4